MVVCINYNSSLAAEWDEFIDSARTPLFFFKRGFMDYHSDRFEDASLMFYEDGKLSAVFPASRHGKALVSHGGLTFGGMLFSSKVRADTVLTAFDALVTHARGLGYEKILYKAIPYVFASQSCQEDLYALTRHGAVLVRRDLSSVIHLDSRPKLSKGRKWLIARAAKFGLKPEISTDWEGFHDLLSSVLERHGALPTHTPEELRLLHSRFEQNIELKTIRHEGRLLAGAVLFRFGQVTHTQYLATSDEGKEMGALDALIETCIQESAARGSKYFSFGISTEDGGKALNSGLINQKESFGARGMVLDFYEISLN